MINEKKTSINDPNVVSDEEMDLELPKFNPYLAMMIIIAVEFLYYSFWIWALNN
jgi:hypothetical protein